MACDHDRTYTFALGNGLGQSPANQDKLPYQFLIAEPVAFTSSATCPMPGSTTLLLHVQTNRRIPPLNPSELKTSGPINNTITANLQRVADVGNFRLWSPRSHSHNQFLTKSEHSAFTS